MKLHDDELDISADLVRGLVDEQFPAWAGRPLRAVPAAGTDNVMFRLGDDLVVRLPRMPRSAGNVVKEQRWLPYLAPFLPLAVPAPVGLGRPAAGYPMPWSVYAWRPGDHRMGDSVAAATALGDFVAALQAAPVPADAPAAYRAGNYQKSDAYVREALGDLDVPGAAALWDAGLELPGWERAPVWVHSDLLPTNVLYRDGRLDAVIDFGCAGVGDPACDLMAAWALFDPAARQVFRNRLAVDDATWERGRAWALLFGLGAWHYYDTLKPEFAALGRRTVNQTLTDRASST
ncbi:aminoglycoside phosphotransferase (APT) family kinase protein [Actinoplanes tereljensis]|uniref:Phosphotransferase n=1 Tax=Paractinoplanes tereljensis TaxID=571912 RepID=A0A919NRH8_9ACTN|nr:aminoglycoside phosphotransferase family protein [Actinoplanes tereljensis]GIF22272.1 phosphotransferase [Actinoplanes tereljensis]